MGSQKPPAWRHETVDRLKEVIRIQRITLQAKRYYRYPELTKYQNTNHKSVLCFIPDGGD